MMGNSGDSKAFNVLSYIGPLFIVLFLAEIACSIVLALLGLVLGFIPVLGAILTWIVSLAVAAIVLLFILYGIRNALSGSRKELPYIGHLEFIH